MLLQGCGHHRKYEVILEDYPIGPITFQFWNLDEELEEFPIDSGHG
jgi:hypothetical protein